MTHRYSVQYGDTRGSRKRYCVWDLTEKRVVFADDSKSTVIADAQRRNGFVVDGSEQTFGRQIAARRRPRTDRNADRIDGYDRDDLGLSPDY